MPEPHPFTVLPGAERSPIWQAYQRLEQTQWLAPEQLESLQLQKVRELLSHCQRNVPYYRELFARERLAPADIRTFADFRRLPILPRRTWQERYPDFLAEALPPTIKAAGTVNTSGTSGIAVQVRQTNLGNLWWLAFYLRDLAWCGVDVRKSIACIRTIKLKTDEQRRKFLAGISQRSWHSSLAGIIETGVAHGMDLHQDPRKQLAWLRQVKPHYLLSHPANLDFLGHLVRDSGEPLAGLLGIQSFSDTLDDDVRRRVEAAFGVAVKNTYSCMEAGYVASPCPSGSGLHVHGENVILELLDAAGNPCAAGQTGRVVLTVLHNHLTPFVRYDILDEATLAEPCSCGRGLSLLARVEGKRRPLMRVAGGRWKSPINLLQTIRAVGPHVQQQIIQKADGSFLVRIVPAPGWTEEHARRIPEIVNDYCESPVHTDVEILGRLPLPPGGKVQEVVSELTPTIRAD
jgi:phenylacetate-CoA ligase